MHTMIGLKPRKRYCFGPNLEVLSTFGNLIMSEIVRTIFQLLYSHTDILEDIAFRNTSIHGVDELRKHLHAGARKEKNGPHCRFMLAKCFLPTLKSFMTKI